MSKVLIGLGPRTLGELTPPGSTLPDSAFLHVNSHVRLLLENGVLGQEVAQLNYQVGAGGDQFRFVEVGSIGMNQAHVSLIRLDVRPARACR